MALPASAVFLGNLLYFIQYIYNINIKYNNSDAFQAEAGAPLQPIFYS